MVNFSQLSDQRSTTTTISRELSEEQKLALADEAMQIAESICDLEERKAELNKALGDQIKELRGQHKSLVKTYREGGIAGEEEVTVGFDWNAGAKWYRTKDGLYFGPYAIAESDRQSSLPVTQSEEEEVTESSDEVADCAECNLPTLIKDMENVSGRLVCTSCSRAASILK